jgi:hypothetical protein
MRPATRLSGVLLLLFVVSAAATDEAIEEAITPCTRPPLLAHNCERDLVYFDATDLGLALSLNRLTREGDTTVFDYTLSTPFDRNVTYLQIDIEACGQVLEGSPNLRRLTSRTEPDTCVQGVIFDQRQEADTHEEYQIVMEGEVRIGFITYAVRMDGYYALGSAIGPICQCTLDEDQTIELEAALAALNDATDEAEEEFEEAQQAATHPPAPPPSERTTVGEVTERGESTIGTESTATTKAAAPAQEIVGIVLHQSNEAFVDAAPVIVARATTQGQADVGQQADADEEEEEDEVAEEEALPALNSLSSVVGSDSSHEVPMVGYAYQEGDQICSMPPHLSRACSDAGGPDYEQFLAEPIGFHLELTTAFFEGDNTVFEYLFELHSDRSLKFLQIGIEECTDGAVETSPPTTSLTSSLDSNTCVEGLRFNKQLNGTVEQATFRVTMAGRVDRGYVTYAAAAEGYYGVGVVEGPNCKCKKYGSVPDTVSNLGQ